MTVEKLRRHLAIAPPKGPLVFAILDGVGWGPRDGGDAVHRARKPHLDRLWQRCPTRTLKAHGTAVGMPSDQDMGNSEVGHNALGSGRVFRQGASLVGDAIASGRLFAGDTWRWLVELAVHGGTLHLCGLLSDGNVHAHVDHVHALLRQAAQAGAAKIRVHALADGRDVPDPSFERYLLELDAVLAELQAGGCDARLASGGGRMRVTMDRYEADWAIVERGWRAHVLGDAVPFPSWQAALQALRQQPGGLSDQNLPPFAIADGNGQPVGEVRDGDAFVFWNFRGDRAIEISKAFEQGPEFTAFDRVRVPAVRFAGMMQYDGDLKLPARYLVEPPEIQRTMGEFLAALGVTTLAVSETQKYGHVTYFWNGNRSGVLAPDVERYVELPSDKLPFDQRPEMQARAVTDAVEAGLRSANPPQFVRLNYANGDMVGHTGNLDATIAAIETVDAEVGRLIALVETAGGVLVVSADHGNADDMWQRDGKGKPLVGRDGRPLARTSHTLARVPLSILDADPAHAATWRLHDGIADAGLANVTATLLALLGYDKPVDYEAAVVVGVGA
jgi:2,3-bisphosphoglycerate-independent phosphoglycerate mutase